MDTVFRDVAFKADGAPIASFPWPPIPSPEMCNTTLPIKKILSYDAEWLKPTVYLTYVLLSIYGLLIIFALHNTIRFLII